GIRLLKYARLRIRPRPHTLPSGWPTQAILLVWGTSFVSGHDFSRAVNGQKICGLQPLSDAFPPPNNFFRDNRRMGRIRILTDQVANQIAAGEVVDRPASVVKELLENSLDAGATRIIIEVEAGGRKLIRISDNGMGMVRDDALLAFERHATSKIRSSDDLLSIATLGFRGEALPSIASIARVQVETRAKDDPSGTALEIAGGKILRVEDAGLPAGTTIAVRD